MGIVSIAGVTVRLGPHSLTTGNAVVSSLRVITATSTVAVPIHTAGPVSPRRVEVSISCVNDKSKLRSHGAAGPTGHGARGTPATSVTTNMSN